MMRKTFVRLENNEEALSKLVKYMEKADNTFNIPLSSRVDILDYAKKLLRKGVVLATIKDDFIVGIIGFYCNDKDSKKGYITVASLTKDAQKEGYNVRDLFYASNLIALKNGISSFYCEAVDHRAAILYQRTGFTEICRENINNITHYHLMCDIKKWMTNNSERQITISNWEE